MIPIVLYCRYSSSSQSEQSIEGQLKVCHDYAERNGYKVIGEYIDRAISGTGADNRPEFQRMIADSAKRQFNFVLVYQLDRFARNRYDSVHYKRILKKNGVKVLSARENITEDASGILLESMLEGLSEYYSVELGQKIKRGMALNAEKCLYTGAGLSLGYSIDENKKYIINGEETAVVRQIFDLYITKGYGLQRIATYLFEQGVRNRKGINFTNATIHHRLKNIHVVADMVLQPPSRYASSRKSAASKNPFLLFMLSIHLKYQQQNS